MWTRRSIGSFSAVWRKNHAFEPVVRRFWPQTLISWTRLLDGRVRDPTVGRDLLLGTVGGVGISLMFQMNLLAHRWFLGMNQASGIKGEVKPISLAGSKELVASALEGHLNGINVAVIVTMALDHEKRYLPPFLTDPIPHRRVSCRRLMCYDFLNPVPQPFCIYWPSRMSKTTNVSHWIDLVKAGDSTAANRIWQHYFDRLVRSVRGRLYGQNRAVSDEEDIVLSVFDSFYNAAENGRFPDLSDRDDLWRLLLRMAARKVVDKRRHDLRQRRGGNVRLHSLDQAGDDENVFEAIGDEPSAEMVLMMQESVEQILSHLGVGQLRDLAGAKLEGYSNAELAQRFGCSERTIERRLHLIREKCQQELAELNEHPSEKTTDCSPGTD